MKETGIIMSGDHPKLVLDGRKTQTRRVVNIKGINIHDKKWVNAQYNPKYQSAIFNDGIRENWDAVCPYGQVGDRLWVRERYSIAEIRWRPDGKSGGATVLYKAGGTKSIGWNDWLMANWLKPDWDKKRPSIFMPRWASRITLEITEVRVERVQEITEADIKTDFFIGEIINGQLIITPATRESSPQLWDTLNEKRGYGWEVNPWVWVISFKVVK